MSDTLLGIDTGGTYTDGVLLDSRTRQVLASTKTPTTPADLQSCILKAMDALLPDDPGCVSLVGISTTLATNMIAEGKGRPVGLMLLGYDRELVARFDLERRLAADQIAYIAGGHTLQGAEQGPLDTDAVLKKLNQWSEGLDAIAVSGYFSPFNAAHEQAVGELVADHLDLPLVLGHQLTSRLNSIERATTAALNASLIPSLSEFILAMQAALQQRRIRAPLMILKGDGALTLAAAAAPRPVETVHSGPAASAFGGSSLSGLERALVVDIGGTTTDLAIVEGGRVQIREEGAIVGGHRTAVRAVDVRSFGLGGDSLIHLDAEDRLEIGPTRVMPLCQLAAQDPRVARDLLGRRGSLKRRAAPDSVEYWFLQRDAEGRRDNARAGEALDLLRQHPWPLPALLERLGSFHPLQLGVTRLLREGVIGRAALTPTDLLHATGEFTRWHVDTARIAAEHVAQLMGVKVEILADLAKGWIAERIHAEIVAYISGQRVEAASYHLATGDLGTWLYEQSLRHESPYLDISIDLKLPLIGIGAPAGFYLPRVAEMLDTDLILPPHYEVANAVGAVAGSVMVSKEAWVYPRLRNMHPAGYYLQLGDVRRSYPDLAHALEAAKEELSERVRQAALEAGAHAPEIEFERLAEGAESYRLRARAIGTPSAPG